MSISRSVLVISFTAVNSEPRVLRQIDAFKRAGWHVIVCGYIVGPGLPPETEMIEIPAKPAGRRTVMGRLKLLLKLLISHVRQPYVDNFYWDYTGAMAYLDIIQSRLNGKRPDLIVCHDYISAPLAARLTTIFNNTYVLDIHEYAVEQHMHNLFWKLCMRRWVDRIQRKYINQAGAVTTVCKSIAEALQQDYSLVHTPTVVLSVPFYQQMPLNCPVERLIVLYHGNITPIRGLESLLGSIRYWEPRFSLVIRGKGEQAYVQSLKRLAVLEGVTDRVTFEDPVPFDQIVSAANRADIGYFVQENISRQKQYALPNKFFEYIMAGLALCVNDFQEMASLVNQYKLGKLVQDSDPLEIARIINSFTRDEVLSYKRQSLLAAAELCWENEQKGMLDIYINAIRPG